MQIQCQIRFIICPFSDYAEKYYISSPVSSPVSFLTQMPSVLMILHLLRGQKPLNRKFPTGSPDMLWLKPCNFFSPSVLYLSIYPQNYGKYCGYAGPKCIGTLGSLLSNINPPHLHSSLRSLINIYYFLSSLCTAWQCSTALGLVAVESGVAKGSTKRCNAPLHFQVTPDHASHRNCCFPS